jgi:hypothetical protein
MQPLSNAPEGQPTPERSRVPVGWVVLVVMGALLSLLTIAPLFGGGFLLWANATQRDDAGFFTTRSERLETTSYAITSEEIDLGADPTDEQTVVDLGDIATVRIDVAGRGDSDVFVGIGPRREVDRYLQDVAHAEIDDITFGPFAVDFRYRDGGEPASPPGEASFWVASEEGGGDQSLVWEPTSGDWSVVIMNADASAGVSVDAALGAKSPWVFRIGLGLVIAGVIGLFVAVSMLVIGVVGLARGSRRGSHEAELVGSGGSHPVRLEARLEEPLNRWLWLVKWILLIPHLIVLVVLWVAFAVVSVVAFFAILFTERYPRALFDFNLGVLRWTWRVNYYGYSALGTDRYPPFSMAAEADYPATLAIDYPDRLSRGKVLVKWWLLALPHYMVLAIIAGGAAAGSEGGWWIGTVPFGGLIGLLVFFAGVALLFSGHYPRGMHDFVIGLNRWWYRVIAYAALMRDDYPPFRLDQGGSEAVEPGEDPVTSTSTP